MYTRNNIKRTADGAKLYPFSARKHAHDIEFRRNRCANELDDLLNGIGLETTRTKFRTHLERVEALDKMQADLTDLLAAVLGSMDDRQVAWLTGPQLALAKETALWAAEQRGVSYE